MLAKGAGTMGNDPGYLKKYVKTHPDNKMAWYLLGKAYEEQGKLGKAKYCFKQAGEIYEAYERKTLPGAEQEHKEQPEAVPALYDPELEQFFKEIELEEAEESSSHNHGWRKAALLLIFILLLFIVIPTPYGPDEQPLETAGTSPKHTDKPHTDLPEEPGSESARLNPAEEATPGETNEKPSWHLHDQTGEQLRDQMHFIYVAQPFAPERIRSALGSLLLAGDAPLLTVLAQAQMTEDGRWALWDGETIWLAAAERLPHSGDVLVRMYDPRLCECDATDQASLADAFPGWRKQMEELLVAVAARRAFIASYGREPASAEEMVRDYPHNVLPGLTLAIEQILSGEPMRFEILSATSRADGEQRDEAYDDTKSFPGKHSPTPALEIIVDKANHRLALVSGNLILRNYEVGLGGELTPEGVFFISEKVKNPNGRADGEYGSRGMTLSDTLYAIHGTNEPESIGQDSSNGCVRMRKDDIEELFDMVPLGTKVTITSGVLPDRIVQGEERFRLPEMADETNDGKVYQWLN